MNNLSAHDNIIVIGRKGLPEDNVRGFFEVPHSEGEVHSDRNLYHAVNTDTGEAVDIGEWLKQRRTAGHDLHSKAGDPRFLSLDPDSPDFLVSTPDGPAAALRERGFCRVKDQLIWLFMVRGVPEHIRLDNGPEFIANSISRWLERAEVETLYVEPGEPWENGYGERSTAVCETSC